MERSTSKRLFAVVILGVLIFPVGSKEPLLSSVTAPSGQCHSHKARHWPARPPARTATDSLSQEAEMSSDKQKNP